MPFCISAGTERCPVIRHSSCFEYLISGSTSSAIAPAAASHIQGSRRPDKGRRGRRRPACQPPAATRRVPTKRDRKSTRLNSSHVRISYAVFCLKKKKKKNSPDHDHPNMHGQIADKKTDRLCIDTNDTGLFAQHEPAARDLALLFFF